MANNKLISYLTIITPFKDISIEKLYQTINYLYKQNLKIIIRHLILYDISCPDLSEIKDFFINKNKYFIEFIRTDKKGIYNSINEGLKYLKDNDYYIVLGAGDLIFLENINKLKIKKLLFCKYKLSNKQKQFTECRNLYSGMPYCHNAIIFKNNKLLYSNDYSISSDYDYFIKFIRMEDVNIFDRTNYNEKINIVFESEEGISSKSFIKKNLQNLSILNKNFGIKYIFIYIIINIRKLIKIIYE